LAVQADLAGEAGLLPVEALADLAVPEQHLVDLVAADVAALVEGRSREAQELLVAISSKPSKNFCAV
jgi:hypothetical protein